MRCRYCNIVLAPSRSIIHGDFCCDDHRQIYEAEGASATPVREPVYEAIEKLRRKFAPQPAPAPEPEAAESVPDLPVDETSDIEPETEPEPEPAAAFESLETEAEPQHIVEAFSGEGAAEGEMVGPEREH